MADDIVKKVAMFLVGFTMLAAFLLALSCANYSVKRFQLPLERVGLFINITKNTMELAVFFSTLIGNIIIWFTSDKDKGKNNVPKIGSLFTNWLLFVMLILSLVAYKSGGDSGNLKFYFWTLVSHVFVCVINFVFSLEVDPDNVTYIYVGRQLLSIFISVYHNIFLYFANKYEMDNIDYWIVYGQLVIMIIFTCATALLWTYSTYSKEFIEVAKCFKNAFFESSGSQPASPSRAQESSSKCCCCCSEKCKNSCKDRCQTPGTGDQGCTCCQENKCCCCCEDGSKTEHIKYKCLFIQIFYVFLQILNGAAKAIYGYLEERYHCTTETIEGQACKCCCCKSPEYSCPCLGHQQDEEEECKCCCCTTSQDSKPTAQTTAKKDTCDKDTGDSADNEGELWDEFKKPLLWSPAMIYIFANGTIYSVYPGVSPYQLVSADVGYKIGLINLLLSPIIPIAICILDLDKYCLGPSKKWEKEAVGWHAVWAGVPLAIICIFLFFYTLHYPESMIGRSIYGNNVLVGLLTVSFVVVLNGLQTIGPTATKSQVQNEKHKGTVTTIIYSISSVFANASGFIGDGYLQTFRKHSRDNWPTKGYTRYRGFKFWLGSACKVAVKSILNVFNSDIRARIESFS